MDQFPSGELDHFPSGATNVGKITLMSERRSGGTGRRSVPEEQVRPVRPRYVRRALGSVELRRLVADYVSSIRRLTGEATTSEETYYPDVRDLWARVLAALEQPFEARTGTKQRRAAGGVDRPDLAIFDGGEFVSVFGEVKLPDANLEEVAFSEARNNQVGRYLAQTGVVIVSNVREFGLVACRAGYPRSAEPVPAEQRALLQKAVFWKSEASLARGEIVDDSAIESLLELVDRALTEFAPISEPATLARVLARLARAAKKELPEEFDAVSPLLDDFKIGLGLTFEGKEGLDFFKSSLIQTAYYGLFAAWTLWHRADDGQPFEWDRLERYLKIPFLGQLFYDLKSPDRLAELGLAPHLERATQVLGRVERHAFFERFTYGPASYPPPTRGSADSAGGGHSAPEKAITYFYEPFLEAFDPHLRKSLGVWYTPPEIVRYQVRRVEQLLRQEFGCTKGFADERVIVLDPCCGTGAYLLEVVKCIVEQLRTSGEENLIGAEVHAATMKRLLGFELLTAPFVIAQLQLYMVLADLGVTPTGKERPAVFLTNALAGWSEHDKLQGHLSNPALKKERELSNRAKLDAKVIVVLGNPPYNRFAGTAIDEEAQLVDHYKGIRRVPKTDRKGKPIYDQNGKVVFSQRADSDLYRVWGVRKQLLDDLYVRFLRLAEKRIGEQAEYGVVSLISNSSYLTGRSHPIMRESLLRNFHEIWIDNLNGDKYRTGKVIPEGCPGAGAADQSIFTTDRDSRGIQVGVCISTFVKRPLAEGGPEDTAVWYRDFWGRADDKRGALLSSLGTAGFSDPECDAANLPHGPRRYERLYPTRSMRWLLATGEASAGYEAWAALDELFPVSFQGVNPNRGLDGSLIEMDREQLEARMRDYFGPMSFSEFRAKHPILATPRARYSPEQLRDALRSAKVEFKDEQIVPYLVFPLDQRNIYYETEAKLLNERRPELWDNLRDNEFLLAVPQPRQVSESRPLFARTLLDLHVHDVGSVAFPREVRDGTLQFKRAANIAHSAWLVLARTWARDADLRGDQARSTLSELFRFVLATTYSPRFEEEHEDALRQDWAHVPIPRDRNVFEKGVEVGDRVAALLDASREADGTISQIIGLHRMRHLAVLSTVDGAPIRPEGEELTFAYFGGGRGKFVARPFIDQEQALRSWGANTGDLWLNERVFVQNVPANVWEFEIGGYPVLKKWLGYRQAKRRGGRPMMIQELRTITGIVRRLAALLELRVELDEVYELASSNAFAATDLGLREA